MVVSYFISARVAARPHEWQYWAAVKCHHLCFSLPAESLTLTMWLERVSAGVSTSARLSATTPASTLIT